MKKKTIPSAVIEAAKPLIMHYGENLVFLGQKNTQDIYLFKMPDNLLTGYPFVFLYDSQDDTVDIITRFDAVDIVGKYLKK